MKKEFFLKKSRMKMQIGLSTLFILFFSLAVFGSLNEDFDTSFLVIYILGLIVFGYNIYNTIRLIIKKTPILSLDQDGVSYQPRTSNIQYLPWDEIERIGLMFGEDGDYLLVKTKNFSESLDQPRSKLSKMFRYDKNIKWMIPSSILCVSLLEIMDAFPTNKEIHIYKEERKTIHLSKKEMSEESYLSKVKHLEKKTRKERYISQLSQDEVVIYFLYRMDYLINEQGLYSYLTSKEQFSLWASIQALKDASSIELFELARRMQELRKEDSSSEVFLESCTTLEKEWNESKESAMNLALDYWNKSLKKESI